ncbi:hypothetical protein [Streptomyces sp. NPDC002520]
MSVQVRGYERFGVEPAGGIPYVDGFPFLAIEAHQLMRRESAWLTFRISMGGDRGLVIVFRNLEDDDGVDYVVDPGQERDCIRIAAVEGHFLGPGISWDELEAIANAADGPVGKAQRLLLLAPMYSDARYVDRAAEEFSWAFRQVGATGDPDDLARLLAEGGMMWGEPEWFMGEDGAWTCAGELSYRNPDGHSPLDLESRLEVDRVLRGTHA